MKRECLHCRKEAEIELKYSKKSLCKPCFCRLIEKRISRNIRVNRLINKSDKIAVAVSGGKDSYLTLHFLKKYCLRGNIPLLAIYVDRSDPHSANQLEMARKQVKELEIPFHIITFKKELGLSMDELRKITAKPKAKLCSTCGIIRRKLLNQKAKELGATKLATGHNMTDEAQTYLMNFTKNELRHFIGMGPTSPKVEGFIPRIKILRDVPENEIKLYCEIKGYDFLPEPCPYRIGSLRFNYQKSLNDINGFRPGAEFAICAIGEKITEFAREKYKSQKFSYCKKCGEPSAKEICRVCQILS